MGFRIENNVLVKYTEEPDVMAAVIPDGITCIGEEAFLGCERVTAVHIPDSVTEIRAWAFASCTSLTAITLPRSVIQIGDAAFYACESLTRFRWSGWVNASHIRCHIGMENKISECIRMVQYQSFWECRDDGVRIPFLVGCCRERREPEVLNHCRVHFAEIGSHLIAAGDTASTAFFAEEAGFFTAENIDKFLEYAIEKKQTEIYTILINYKSEVLGFKDPKAKFKL